MADTIEKTIFQALMLRMQALPLPVGMTLASNVALPGVAFAPSTTTKFISFEIHFNRPIETDLSLEMDPIRQGFIRGNVMWPKSFAQVDAVDLAGNIRSHFKRGTKLYQNGVQVRFDEDPEVGVLMIGTTHLTVPVTAFWRSFPQAPA
ncbi:phage tail terminator-like protein [Pararhizobium sp. DWP1-1-3]|uniref:phage tail terminator-like protein n=1 Tax=Pararhizobium sp. DWP1-1-3 TaxID=2804652 RepID=UPI003CE919CB